MITCLYKPNGDHTEAFSPLYPKFRSDQFFGFTRQYANKQCTVPRGTSVGKDKHSLSIGSAKFKHERNAIMQHQPVFKLQLHPVQLPVKPPLAS